MNWIQALICLVAGFVASAVVFAKGYSEGCKHGENAGNARGWSRAWQEQEGEIDRAYILRGEAVSTVSTIAKIQDPEARRKAVEEWAEYAKQRVMRRRNP